MGWNLYAYDTIRTSPPESNSILQPVIDGFSPGFLNGERRIGPKCIQSPPKAQYQDEFYCSCHARWKGPLIAYPELGMKNGRVDFYIPSKKWGVKLLREGDWLGQHSGPFARLGADGRDLLLDDYIILDCPPCAVQLSRACSSG